MSGYADGGDAPDKRLQLVPGALEEARAFLEGKADTHGRFARVSELVDGFESPFGLELLVLSCMPPNCFASSDTGQVDRAAGALFRRRVCPHTDNAHAKAARNSRGAGAASQQR